MTLGYFLDLLIINEVRREKVVEDDETKFSLGYELSKQNGFLLKEIATCVSEVYNGTRPGVFSKNKKYDRDVKKDEDHNLVTLFYKLYQKHLKLWELEDTRRDKSLPDSDRLAAADQVSIFNKQRNDLVERIDFIVSESINKAKVS